MNSRRHVEILAAMKLPLFEAYKAIEKISYDLTDDIYLARHGERPQPVYTEEEVKTAVYVNSWDIFFLRRIPFTLWSDIAEEGLALLKEMIETGDFDYEKNPKYKEFMEHFYECADKLHSMPEYRDRFGMGF